MRKQLDEEPRPHLVADRDAVGVRRELADDGSRVFCLAPWQEVEDAGLRPDTGGLEPGDEHRGVAVARQDEHREPFERHGHVPGEVWQVVADRQQDGVDVLLGHGCPDPGEPVEVDGRVEWWAAHAPILPAARRPVTSQRS